MQTVLLILLILILLGGVPYSAVNWGPYPASGLGLVLIVLIIFIIVGGRV